MLKSIIISLVASVVLSGNVVQANPVQPQDQVNERVTAIVYEVQDDLVTIKTEDGNMWDVYVEDPRTYWDVETVTVEFEDQEIVFIEPLQ